MSQRIQRPALVVLLVAISALGACATPTAPSRNLKPEVRSADQISTTSECKGGWIGSSGRC